MSDQRPDPDKLLHHLQEEERQQHTAKLKIYLGAAPGVGKTHEMLNDALAKRAEGFDVIVGVVESHGRKEIENLLKKFEVLPKMEVDYLNKKLLEFDIDGALKRQPSIILVDEMAHTNAPGLRHKKRWQDIKELLDRGIHVYTTLNVQHIESVSDQAAAIIHAPIRETIPDSMIEMADTIELVDLPPEELLKRLKEGKVYIQQQADLAAEHFFKKGNLIALRELALRALAERVNAQVLLYRQGQGIKHIWPSREKILVCVGEGMEAPKLIRAARRMSAGLQVEWLAVFVDTPSLQSSESKRNRSIQNLLFAEQLGATTRVLSGSDIVKEILNFAHEQNVTQIMVWKHIRPRYYQFFHRNIADELVRYSGEIDVYIMTGTNQQERKPSRETKEKTNSFLYWLSYVGCVGLVGAETMLNAFLFSYFNDSILVMLYMLGNIFVALLSKAGPAIFTAFLSVLAYDFFFVKPYYSLEVADLEYIFIFFVIFFVSLVINYLTQTIRRQSEIARLAANQTSTLHTLSTKLASTRGINKLLAIGTDYLAKIFDCRVVALMPKGGQLIATDKNETGELDKKELGIAQWAHEMGRMAGLGTDTLSFSKALYLPLIASHNTVGVLRIVPNTKRLLSPEQMHLMEVCANQVALAIEVDTMQEKKKQKELKTETVRVQNALLQAVSHDLRTPLVAVLANASTLVEMSSELSAKQIKQIGMDIYFELEQQNRLINNLLQITYLENESFLLQKQPISLTDVINLVVKTSSKKLLTRKLDLDIADNLPAISADSFLLQEVLLNLIDNAVKFAGLNSPIAIRAHVENNSVCISIEDEGPGIVDDEKAKLFEKFYRGRELTEKRGLGLGLAICRVIINAHGGKIWAENKPGHGAKFCFTLPISTL